MKSATSANSQPLNKKGRMNRFLLTTCICILSLTSVKAQFVTIPDANFVSFLQTKFPACMNGNQMDTTCPGIVNATTLDCSQKFIANLSGIQYFDNLNNLNASGNIGLNSLPGLPSTLDTVDCSFTGLTSLPALPPGLIYLDCSQAFIPNIPALPSTLKLLYLGDVYFFVSAAHFTYTNFPPLPAGMVDFQSGGGTMPQEFTSLPGNLEYFVCMNCGLTSLPELPQSLIGLDVTDNQLTSLPSFEHFRQNSVYLDYVAFKDNPVTCFPLLPFVGDVSWGGTQISCLPVDPIFRYNLINPPYNLPFCNIINDVNQCYFSWNITGEIYLDQDNNCASDITDEKLKNIPVQLWSGGNIVQQTVTDVNGQFYFDTDFGNFQVRVDTAGLPFNAPCPANNQFNVNITSLDPLETGLEFGLRCKPDFDLEAHSIVHDWFQPGLSTEVYVGVGEVGQIHGGQCVAGQSGSVVITLSGPITFLNPMPGALTPTVINNMLIYNVADFNSVDPFSDFNFIVNTNTNAQQGQQVCLTLTVGPTTGDRNVSNNTLTKCLPVVNSMDPNDKQVSPYGNISATQEWLTYTVRFQNTGNANAIDIYIDDIIDNNLDKATFQLLTYSHQPFVELEGSAVRFSFPNINLPDSTSNEPGSHGYIQYKVKPKTNLPVGTVITNTAYIYFDYNPAVITNTVQTTIGLKFSGSVVSESGNPVPSVKVDISGDASASVLTNASGSYELTSSKLGNFIVTPAKNNDHLKANGVTTLDIAFIRRHTLGGTPLSSPYKIIAADVNGSNSVTVADITIIRKLVLGMDTSFSGKLWTFVPADQVFADPQNPFPYNAFKNYIDLNANQTNQNFIGVRLGDVNGSWNPATPKMSVMGEVQFAMNEYQTLRDEVITIPVQVRDFNEIAGYQFTMTWDAEVLELLEVNNRSVQGLYGRFDREGKLTTTWNDDAGGALTLQDGATAFELKFRVVGTPGTSTEIKIGSEITNGEAYTSLFDLLDIVSTEGKVTVGDGATSNFNPQTTGFQLQVQPNPFSNATNITFSLPQNDEVKLEIYDVLMKEVKTFSGFFNAGTHQLQWNGENNNGTALPNGTYYVKMVAGIEAIGERERVMLIR